MNAKVNKMIKKGKLFLKKHSPVILIAAGVAGSVTSTVMACKATLKATDVLDMAKVRIDDVHKALELGTSEESDIEYTKKDSKKDLTIIYAQTGLELLKLYGPAIVVGSVSVGCILGSHNILSKRNVAISAALASVTDDFKGYRSRVIDKLGDEMDKELKYGIREKDVEEVVQKEDGSTDIIQTKLKEVDPNTVSGYAKFYDETCKGWTKSAEANRLFLEKMQQYANNKLQADGYLFLNDVYEMIGIPKTKYGQVVGWIYDINNKIGDNYVSFGIMNIHDPNNRDFVNGYEPSILLDFNVDGNILDFI